MSKSRILLQLDTDPQVSVFDGVVALDAGVDHLLRHAELEPVAVRDLVFGAIFTRSSEDLKHTAIFVGGSDVVAGEALLAAVQQAFVGPLRVSVMLDSNGANTTAAAAVLIAGKHLSLRGAKALVLAATGPVGSRVARLLAVEGAEIRVASRQIARAEATCRQIAAQVPGARLEPYEVAAPESVAQALDGRQLVIAAGAPGVELLSDKQRQQATSLQVAIDLSAVPPLGIGGLSAHDKARRLGDVVCYGAIGVGGTKMKIHKAAIQQLFEANDQVLDAAEIYALGRQFLTSG